MSAGNDIHIAIGCVHKSAEDVASLAQIRESLPIATQHFILLDIYYVYTLLSIAS